MERQQWNDGQEIIFQDLNKLQSRIYKSFFDDVIFELMRRKVNGFFNDSFKVLFTGATSAQVSKGLGFMTVSGGLAEEPIQQALFRPANVAVAFSTPDNTDPRIDIVVTQPAIVDKDTESRKFKDDGTGNITNENLVVTNKDEAEFSVVAGTPDASPVAPAVPAGFLKISTHLINATTGMANQSDITDERSLLPLIGSPTATGSENYNRISGDTSLVGVTDEDLATALGNAVAGDKILVIRSETIDSIPDVILNNIEIVFKRGVVFTKGSATVGLRITGNDCLVLNGHFKDFSTGGDKGIDVVAAANRTILERSRYDNCNTNLADAGTDTFNNNEATI